MSAGPSARWGADGPRAVKDLGAGVVSLPVDPHRRTRRGGLALRSAARPLTGDAALRAAWAEHAPELTRFATRALGDRGAAEEVVQETFLRAWQAADRYDPEQGSLRTWLFSICRRVVIDQARARAARPPLAHAEPADRAATTDQFEQALLGWQLEEALRSVPTRQREVLVEVAVRGRPVAEVADQLGIPAGTVHSRVFYGLRALRVVLEEMGWVDDH